ncbi:hypothetical protein TNIN_122751 [Trichonephila inaurata madagascariensis]|uniref:Uncharacterized protein n=1 Tax=Trichonephila inaurata madagascariensis TaxID=2747483 RepID=A0A8X7CMR6_9ARAC|nr:hypothetical protein TNIN_122751 [Trichonephila inaurata madagascariensis]
MILSDRLSETARYLTAAPVVAWKSFGTQKTSSNFAPHEANVRIDVAHLHCAFPKIRLIAAAKRRIKDYFQGMSYF